MSDIETTLRKYRHRLYDDIFRGNTIPNGRVYFTVDEATHAVLIARAHNAGMTVGDYLLAGVRLLDMERKEQKR